MSLLRRYGRSVFYLMATDWLILVGTFGLALHWRRYAPNLNIITRSHIANEALTIFFYAFLMVAIFGALRLYKRKTLLSWASHLLRIIQGVAICTTGYLLLVVLTKSIILVPSRLVILNWTLLQLSALIIHRTILFPALVKAATRAQMQRRVIIIGTSEASIRFAQNLADQRQYSTLSPVGFLSVSNCQEKGTRITGNLLCLGKISDLPELVQLHKIEGAVITPTLVEISYQDLMDLIEQCVRLFGWVDVHTDKSAVWHKNLDADTYFDIPFVRMREIPSGPLIHAYKKTTDLIGSLIGIVLLAPLLLATAIAIKLTSPGPVFYTRDRVGKDGKLFAFYKFRSMYTGADQDPQRNAEIEEYLKSGEKVSRKTINIGQVTPVGRFIRKWAVDELPQLFNVAKGDMSLIGPRPVPLNEYETTDEWHRRRFAIKPGCAGLWKVYASREGISMNDTTLYDIYYARNMGPLLDLYILFATIWIIVTGRADG